MPIRLIPFDSDPESDLETQLAVMAALDNPSPTTICTFGVLGTAARIFF